jgi:hypothetical protein
MARNLLQSFVHGLAYSFHTRRNELTTGLTGNMQAAVNQLFAGMDARYDGAQVKLPTFQNIRDGIRVRLMTFDDRGTTTGHPAPDPHLLACKAAHNYSWQHGQQMRAAAEPKEMDELDLLAEEIYINSCQHVQESDVIGSIITLPSAQPKRERVPRVGRLGQTRPATNSRA